MKTTVKKTNKARLALLLVLAAVLAFFTVGVCMSNLFSDLGKNGSNSNVEAEEAANNAGVTIRLVGDSLTNVNPKSYYTFSNKTYTLSQPSAINMADNATSPSGSVRGYQLTFTPGTYSITLAGAQGGTATINTYRYNPGDNFYSQTTYGEYGDRVTATLKFTKTKTLYLIIGSPGSSRNVSFYGSMASPSVMFLGFYDENAPISSSLAGGLNGNNSANGEKLPPNSNRTNNLKTATYAGGGGFTDLRTSIGSASGLSKFNSSASLNSSILLAEGGGGGAVNISSSTYRVYANEGRYVTGLEAGAIVNNCKDSMYKSSDDGVTVSGYTVSNNVNGRAGAPSDGYATITCNSLETPTTSTGISKVKADIVAEDYNSLFKSDWSEDSTTYSYTTGNTMTLEYPSYTYSGGMTQTGFLQNAYNIRRYWKLTLQPGTYTFNLYGAQGGIDSQGGIGGYGGRSTGTLTVTKQTVLYAYIGGAGMGGQGMTVYGGYNGGGDVVSGSSAGGGATDLRLVSGAWDSATGLNSRIMVAGGGGGANDSYNGGAGGGLVGEDGKFGGSYQYVTPTGGGQIDGGTSLACPGKFGAGGGSLTANGGSTPFNGSQDGGGGGGGWYGGGKGAGYTSTGAGGSSYISGLSGCTTRSDYAFTGAAVTRGANGNTKAQAVYGSYYIAKSGYITISCNDAVSTTSKTTTWGATYAIKGVQGLTASENESLDSYAYPQNSDVDGAPDGDVLLLKYPGRTLDALYDEASNTRKRYYTVTLPAGLYKITLAGAQGGSVLGYNGIGGAGAVVTAHLKIETTTTFDVHVGGAGASFAPTVSLMYGGFNGGGNATGAGGGGGATDIRLSTQTAETYGANNSLTVYNSRITSDANDTRIMIAGGGGGANDNSNGGASGGSTASNLLYGMNGVGTGGASGGTHTSDSNRVRAFGQGRTADGGGGGGGYIGGARGTSNTAAGGAGSSYVSGAAVSLYNNANITFPVYKTTSNYVFTNATIQPGANKNTDIDGTSPKTTYLRSADGYAMFERLNVAAIAQTPEAVESEIGLAELSQSITIESKDLATDEDIVSTNANDKKKITYCNSLTDTTFDLTAAKLYVKVRDTSSNRVELIDADEYVSYAFANDRQLNITKVKRYASLTYKQGKQLVQDRAGRLQLYTYVSDSGVWGQSYGKLATEVSFAIDTKIPSNMLSTGTASTEGLDITVAVGYENKLKGSGNTFTIASPLVYDGIDASVKLDTSDIYNTLKSRDSATTADDETLMVYVLSNEFGTGETANLRIDTTKSKYVDFYVGNTKMRGYTEIYFYVNRASNGGSVSLDVYQIEYAEKYRDSIGANSAAATHPLALPVWSNSEVRATATFVYTTSNRRPFTTGGYFLFNQGQTYDVTLADIINDTDKINGNTSTTDVMQGDFYIAEIKEATYEYVRVGKDNAINDEGIDATYYNVGSPTDNSKLNGFSDRLTDFRQDVLTTSSSSTTALLSYSVEGLGTSNCKTIKFTPLRATYNMYASGRKSGLGHLYIMVRVVDLADPTDTGIWIPIAFAIKDKAPNTMSSVSQNSAPIIDGAPGDVFYVSPLGVLTNSPSNPRAVLGQYKVGDGVYSTLSSDKLISLATDPDAYETNNFAYDSAFGDLLMISDYNVSDTGNLIQTIESIQNSFNGASGNNVDNTSSNYFEIEKVPLYVPIAYANGISRVRVVTDKDASYFTINERNVGYKANPITSVLDGHIANADSLGSQVLELDRTVAVETINGSDYFIVYGLKVTLTNWTGGEVVYGQVKVVDASETGVGTADEGADTDKVWLGIKVSNNTPTALTTAEVKTGDNANKTKAVEYAVIQDNIIGAKIPQITYTMPIGSSAIFTPYDVFQEIDSIGAHADAGRPQFSLNTLGGVANSSTHVLEVGATRNSPSATEINVEPLLTEEHTDAVKAAAKGFVSAVNSSTTALNSKDTENGIAYYDRMYLARDYYTSTQETYNPYTTENRNKFIDVRANIGSVNYANYLSSITMISQVDFGEGDIFDFDAIVMTASTRTPTDSPIVLYVGICDRSGGVNIQYARIVINVINLPPVVSQPDIAMISATPIYTDEGKGTIVNYSSVEFTSTYDDDNKSGIMTDHEDQAYLSFVYTVAPRVVTFGNRDDLINKTNPTPIDGYMTVNYDAKGIKLIVTALSSTQKLPYGAWIEFTGTDGRTPTILYLQVEVVNSRSELNTEGDYSFDNYIPRNGLNPAEANLNYTVSSASGSIEDRRYIVSDTATADYIATKTEALGKNAIPSNNLASNVYVLSTDYDGRQTSPVLATFSTDSSWNDPPNTASTNSNSVNKGSAMTFASAIPTVAIGTNAVAAVVRNVDANVEVDIAYFITNELGEVTEEYLASNLVTNSDLMQMSTTGTNDELVNKLFEDVGSGVWRFKVTHWAVVIKAIANVTDLEITIKTRDDSAEGGDTMGIQDAYLGNRLAVDTASRAAIDSKSITKVNFSITQTGFTTYKDYEATDYYYTVNGNGQRLLGTYDGSIDGDTSLADKNNLGTVYNANQVPSTAYRYSDTIKVPAVSRVYVPMSYFALPSSLGTATANKENSTLNYTQDTVGYSIDTSYGPAVQLSAVQSVITIRDGRGQSWTGNNLSDNPYVTISTANKNTSNGYNEDSPYINKALALYTSASQTDFSMTIQGQYNNNLIYLAQQMQYNDGTGGADKEGIPSHAFGLTFQRKSIRNSSVSLTISVKVRAATYNNQSNNFTPVAKIDDSGTTEGEVTFKLDIENSPIDIDTTAHDDPQQADIKNNDGYHTDVKFTTDSAAQSFTLDTADTSGAKKIYTTDNNRTTETSYIGYSDKAYFSYASLGMYSSFDTTKQSSAVSGAAFANASSSTAAQKSLENYFRNTAADIVSAGSVADEFRPNPGIYGTNPEGYSSYVNVVVTNSGRNISLAPRTRTLINKSAYKTIIEAYKTAQDTALTGEGDFDWNGVNADTPSKAAVDKIYELRGMVAEWNANEDEVTAAYYPLRIMIYDSIDSKLSVASFVCLEFRVYISNQAPEVSPTLFNSTTKRYEYAMTLSMGNTASVNLSSLLVDSDMLRDPITNNIYTHSKFASQAASAVISGINAESKDYLFNPYDIVNAGKSYVGPSNLTNANLINGTMKLAVANTNGVAELPSESPQPAVVAYLDRGEDGSIESPYIKFKVNDRLIAEDGSLINSVTIALSFSDADGTNWTQDINFVITFGNIKPSITEKANTIASTGITMKSGDSFTLMLADYSKFASNMNSKTFKTYESSSQLNRSTDTQMVPRGLTWDYKDLDGVNDWSGTSGMPVNGWDASTIATTRPAFLTSSTSTANAMHLGWLAIAEDDTPWTLRITNANQYTSNTYFNFTSLNSFSAEDDTSTQKTFYPTAIHIVAKATVSNYPITVAISDMQGGINYFTVEVTVESSKPIAITEEVENKEIAKLAEQLNYTSETATYSLYMSPDKNANGNIVEVDGIPRKVYNNVNIPLKNIAYDPDDGDTDKMAVLQNNARYFVVSNEISVSGSTVNSTNFTVSTTNFLSVNIECTSIDVGSGFGTIQFYIEDPGNTGSPEHALLVTIRIYTVYSSLVNTDIKNHTGLTTAPAYQLSAGSYVNRLDENYKPTELSFINSKNSMVNIEDSDASVSNAGYGYTVNVYAMLVPHATTANAYVNHSSAIFYNSFVADNGGSGATNAANGYYYINENSEAKLSDGTTVASKRIMSLSKDGIVTSNLNPVLLAYINRFMEIELTTDGTLKFTPIATQTSGLLFYVQVEKALNRTTNAVTNAHLKSGFLINVSVENSAPIAIDNESYTSFKGSVTTNNYAEFNIFASGGASATNALFTDYDVSDSITVSSKFENSADYEQAIVGNNGDWNISQKERAITVLVDNANNKISITIERRVDKPIYDTSNEIIGYEKEVTLPVLIRAVDSNGATVTQTINVTICNENSDANSNLTVEASTGDGVRYTVSKPTYSSDGRRLTFTDGTSLELNSAALSAKVYEINAYVKKDRDPLNINFAAFMSDPDYDMLATTPYDTFRVSNEYVGALNSIVTNQYVGDEGITVQNSAVPTKSVATVKPIITNSFTHVGVTVTATEFDRGAVGTTYMRVLDRATRGDDRVSGVVFVLKIHLLNSAPTVIADKQNTVYNIIGSKDVNNLTALNLNISDFVTDPNPNDKDQYLRIDSFTFDTIEQQYISSTVDYASSLFAIETISQTTDPNAEVGAFRITPRAGCYGTQKVTVSVTDLGDLSEIFYNTSFSITINVVFNPTELPDLTTISTYRAKINYITIDTLLPYFESTETSSEEGVETSSSITSNGFAIASADGSSAYVPSTVYSLTSIAPTESARSFVEVTYDEINMWWVVNPIKTAANGVSLVATFTINGLGTTFTRTLNVLIAENTAPQILDGLKGYTFKTTSTDDESAMYQLDPDNHEVTLNTSLLFTDEDISEVRIISISCDKPSLVTTTLVDDTSVKIKFNASGSATITMVVSDETGEHYTCSFTVKNLDLPSPDFWMAIAINYEEYSMFWYIGIGVFGAIVLLIIILCVVHAKRKRARLELEAQLLSEMELEDQMLKLYAGPSGGDQAYGYLGSNNAPDPSSMLASGQATPQGPLLGQGPNVGSGNDLLLNSGHDEIDINSITKSDDEKL